MEFLCACVCRWTNVCVYVFCMVQTTIYLKSSVSYVWKRKTYNTCTHTLPYIDEANRKAIERIASSPAKHKSHYQIFVLRSANVIRLIVWSRKKTRENDPNEFCLVSSVFSVHSLVHIVEFVWSAKKIFGHPRILCSFQRFSRETHKERGGREKVFTCVP